MQNETPLTSQVVEDKSRIGDWEIDLVIGKEYSGALVTIVERKTSFTVSTRVDDKSAKTVTAATIILFLSAYKHNIYSPRFPQNYNFYR